MQDKKGVKKDDQAQLADLLVNPCQPPVAMNISNYQQNLFLK